jgi:3-phenylpropionate/cinnamic acid dioxygenase small subunit
MHDHVREITALIFGYAERLDAGDFEGLADLFADATLRSNARPNVRRGRSEALALYQDLVQLYDGVPRTKHVTTNVIVEVAPEGESAAARSYYTVFQALPDFPLQAIIAGRYHDRFVRRGTAWRFADRLIFVDLVGDLSRHLKQAVQT